MRSTRPAPLPPTRPVPRATGTNGSVATCAPEADRVVFDDGVAPILARLEADATDLRAALASLHDRTDGVDLAAACTRLSKVGESLSASRSVVIAAADLARVARRAGERNTGNWLATVTNTSRTDGNAATRLAQRVASPEADFAATGTAWANGDITEKHAQVLTSGVTRILDTLEPAFRATAQATAGTDVDAQVAAALTRERAELESALLDVASHGDPDDLRTAVEAARIAADRAAASRDAAACWAAQSLRITPGRGADTGLDHVEADLVPEVTAMLRTALDAIRDTIHASGKPAGTPEGILGAPGTSADAAPYGDAAPLLDPDPARRHVPIPAARRDAAAFLELLRATLDRGIGAGKINERPHLEVRVNLDDLTRNPDQGGVGWLIGPARTPIPVPVDTALRHACDPTLHLLITTGTAADALSPHIRTITRPDGTVLNYGRAERLVPDDLRRAIVARDRHCGHPSCRRPPKFCQAHHIKFWWDGGETSLENCVLLCSEHHHLLHEGGWTITAKPGAPAGKPGRWRFHPPPT